MDEPPQNYREPATRPATVIAFCLFCGRSGVGGSSCSTCDVLIADPERDAPVTSGCPRCDGALGELAVGAEATIHACSGCGGVFVGARAWSSFLSSPELLDGLEGRLASPQPLPAFTPLLRCVACGREMERSRFALTSDVQIDVCAEHGMWLDGGELEEAVRFVARRAAAGPAPGDEAARSDGLRPQLNPSDAAYVAELERAGRASIERAVTQMQRERAQDGRYMPPRAALSGRRERLVLVGASAVFALGLLAAAHRRRPPHLGVHDGVRGALHEVPAASVRRPPAVGVRALALTDRPPGALSGAPGGRDGLRPCRRPRRPKTAG